MIELFRKINNALKGHKRRIALLGAFVSEITPEHTVANWIGKGVFILFGSADLVGYTKNKIIKLKQ